MDNLNQSLKIYENYLKYDFEIYIYIWVKIDNKSISKHYAFKYFYYSLQIDAYKRVKQKYIAFIHHI